MYKDVIQRAIVILNYDGADTIRYRNYHDNIYQKIARENDAIGEYTIFVAEPRSLGTAMYPINIDISSCKNIPSAKNLILNKFKTGEYAGQYKYVYIIEDDAKLDSTDTFFNKIESMMEILGHPFWCGTSCNPKNYIFEKFTPRLILHVDGIDERFDAAGIAKLNYMAYESTECLCWNIDKIDDLHLLFNEEIDNLYLLEYIHRMKMTGYLHTNLCFFPTIDEEKTSIIRNKDIPFKAPLDFSRELAILERLQVRWVPNNNIDDVIFEAHRQITNTKENKHE